MSKDISMGGQKIQLSKFDLKDLVENARIAVIAKSGSGKSWVIRDIVRVKKDVPGGCVIAPTDKLTGFYNDIFYPSFIYHAYDETIIPRLLNRQQVMIEKSKERVEKEHVLIKPDQHQLAPFD